VFLRPIAGVDALALGRDRLASAAAVPGDQARRWRSSWRSKLSGTTPAALVAAAAAASSNCAPSPAARADSANHPLLGVGLRGLLLSALPVRWNVARCCAAAAVSTSSSPPRAGEPFGAGDHRLIAHRHGARCPPATTHA